MKTISLIAAMEILKNCDAVILNDLGICNPFIYKSELFLEAEYQNSEGEIWHYEFFASDNLECKVSGDSLFLTDFNGDEIKITILVKKNIEDS